MSEVIVAKAGGTSNATPEAVITSLGWAEECELFVVSAPGRIGSGIGPDAKITDQLFDARSFAEQHGGEIAPGISENITERFVHIVQGLGMSSSMSRWIDGIRGRIQTAVETSQDASSMLGEQLMAEVYATQGLKLLNPSFSSRDLGSDPMWWRMWLENVTTEGERYVLPGNVTKVKKGLVTFGRGGSDISGSLGAYGMRAGLYRNLTDGPAQSADPKLIDKSRLTQLSHVTCMEGRELGLNGTGLLHPAAIIPCQLGNFPTEIRSTFERGDGLVTIMDNDNGRASRERSGKVIAMSLMDNVVAIEIHEPGMAEAIGRLAEFDKTLDDLELAAIDSIGTGADSQLLLIPDLPAAQDAYLLLRAKASLRGGDAKLIEGITYLTAVGYEIGRQAVSILSGVQDILPPRASVSFGNHQFRVGVPDESALDVMSLLHERFIEKVPA